MVNTNDGNNLINNYVNFGKARIVNPLAVFQLVYMVGILPRKLKEAYITS